jgi:hypothetical protein
MKNKKSFIPKKIFFLAVVSKHAKIIPKDGASLTQFSRRFMEYIIQFRAQPDWAYEFPDRTGRDTQIYRTGPAGPD